jgi:hypothetical protein
MKLGHLLLLPALAVSAYKPAAFMPLCSTDTDLTYPTRAEFNKTATKFCDTIFEHKHKHEVTAGYTRRFYDVEVFKRTPGGSAMTRPMAFEIRMKDDKWPGQQIVHEQCVAGFTERKEGQTLQWQPCWTHGKEDKEEQVEIVNDWRTFLHVDGFGDVWFQAFPGQWEW